MLNQFQLKKPKIDQIGQNGKKPWMPKWISSKLWAHTPLLNYPVIEFPFLANESTMSNTIMKAILYATKGT